MVYVTMDMKQKLASYREFGQLYQRCYVKMVKAPGPTPFKLAWWMVLLIFDIWFQYLRYFMFEWCAK